jgi:lincosamide nucleotidyltransferase
MLMQLSEMRHEIKTRLLEAARRDPRIVGVVDYGSSSEGRGDRWSDLDIALFIEDSHLESFEENWEAWAAGFGTLLLAYVGAIGHPWAVYDAEPMPMRVDLVFFRASELEVVLAWPCAPASVEQMVLYDGLGGRLSTQVAEIVGQSLAPDDLRRAFDQACGDLWYYLLRTHVRILRGELWAARHDYGAIIVGNLLALLRLEAGAVEWWRGSSASAGIEKVVTGERLAQLEPCVPGLGAEGLAAGMLAAARLGRSVCAAVADQHGWDWPNTLAGRTEGVLQEGEMLVGAAGEGRS